MKYRIKETGVIVERVKAFIGLQNANRSIQDESSLLMADDLQCLLSALQERQTMNAKMPSEDEAIKEVWKRIHKREDKKPSGLPEYMIREVTAEAYWMACYRWLQERWLK